MGIAVRMSEWKDLRDEEREVIAYFVLSELAYVEGKKRNVGHIFVEQKEPKDAVTLFFVKNDRTVEEKRVYITENIREDIMDALNQYDKFFALLWGVDPDYQIIDKGRREDVLVSRYLYRFSDGINAWKQEDYLIDAFLSGAFYIPEFDLVVSADVDPDTDVYVYFGKAWYGTFFEMSHKRVLLAKAPEVKIVKNRVPVVLSCDRETCVIKRDTTPIGDLEP